MATLAQPFLLQTDSGILEVAVAVPLPVERVMVLYHPRGWQVALVRMDGEEILPTVYDTLYDAERKAAEVALQCDITLVCDDDPDGEIAEGLVSGVEWRDELRDAETRWMR